MSSLGAPQQCQKCLPMRLPPITDSALMHKKASVTTCPKDEKRKRSILPTNVSSAGLVHDDKMFEHVKDSMLEMAESLSADHRRIVLVVSYDAGERAWTATVRERQALDSQLRSTVNEVLYSGVAKAPTFRSMVLAAPPIQHQQLQRSFRGSQSESVEEESAVQSIEEGADDTETDNNSPLRSQEGSPTPFRRSSLTSNQRALLAQLLFEERSDTKTKSKDYFRLVFGFIVIVTVMYCAGTVLYYLERDGEADKLKRYEHVYARLYNSTALSCLGGVTYADLDLFLPGPPDDVFQDWTYYSNSIFFIATVMTTIGCVTSSRWVARAAFNGARASGTETTCPTPSMGGCSLRSLRSSASQPWASFWLRSTRSSCDLSLVYSLCASKTCLVYVDHSDSIELVDRFARDSYYSAFKYHDSNNSGQLEVCAPCAEWRSCCLRLLNVCFARVQRHEVRHMVKELRAVNDMPDLDPDQATDGIVKSFIHSSR